MNIPEQYLQRTVVFFSDYKQDGKIDLFCAIVTLACSMTAVIILIAGDWAAVDRDSAAVMTSHAFAHVILGGQYFVAVALVLFAFTTILGWCVYGERCAVYLFGHKALKPFRLVFTLVVPVGAMMELTLVWSLSDLFNGLMALPNLVALLLLSPVVFKLTREYFARHKNMFDE